MIADWYDYDIGLLSVWYSKFYGINIFLCVSDINEKTGELLLYELKTVKYKDKGEILSYDSKGGCFRAKDRKKCYISNKLKPNCYTKPQIKLLPIISEKGIPVLYYNVEHGSCLYNKIDEWKIKNTELKFTCIGRFKDYNRLIHTYWDVEKNVTDNIEKVLPEA